MQRTSDAAALAGASALKEGPSAVYKRANDFAARNDVGKLGLVSSDLKVTIGFWEAVTKSFRPAEEGSSFVPNAVKVYGKRSQLSLFFASIMGRTETDVARQATAVYGSGNCAGIWGLEGVTCDGNIITNSYDSSDGLYGSSPKYANGDVCSCQDIVVNGGIEIRGDAMFGKGYQFLPSGTSYQVFGAIDEHVCGVPRFEADFIEAELNNDNATIGLTARGHDPFAGSPWNLYVTGTDSLTLTGGTYFLNSVLIDGQATVMVTGPTTIYVTGSAYFTGGGVFNTTLHPPNLVIYSAGMTVNLRGGSGFYGAVIAPDADVILEGTSDLYGTLVGRTLDFDGDTNIHVDEKLIFDLFGENSAAPVLVQ